MGMGTAALYAKAPVVKVLFRLEIDRRLRYG